MPEATTSRPVPARARRRPGRPPMPVRWPALALSLVQGGLGSAQHQLLHTKTQAGQRAQREADRLDRFLEQRIEDILNRLNIPSRSDIDRLNRSVDVLTRKVETLLARDARPPRASRPTASRGKRG